MKLRLKNLPLHLPIYIKLFVIGAPMLPDSSRKHLQHYEK